MIDVLKTFSWVCVLLLGNQVIPYLKHFKVLLEDLLALFVKSSCLVKFISNTVISNFFVTKLQLLVRLQHQISGLVIIWLYFFNLVFDFLVLDEQIQQFVYLLALFGCQVMRLELHNKATINSFRSVFKMQIEFLEDLVYLILKVYPQI